MVFTWSIADAWNWFVHVPVLGFLIMLAISVLAVAAALEWHVWWEANKVRHGGVTQNL